MKHLTSLISKLPKFPKKKVSIGWYAVPAPHWYHPPPKGTNNRLARCVHLTWQWERHVHMKSFGSFKQFGEQNLSMMNTLDLLVTWGHEVVISLIQYLSFVLKLFGSHRHGHSGCSSHFFGSDTEKHVPCSICFWWIMSSQVVKSLHLFTRVKGWWPNFLDRVAAPRLCRGHEYCDKEHPVVPAVIG